MRAGTFCKFSVLPWRGSAALGLCLLSGCMGASNFFAFDAGDFTDGAVSLPDSGVLDGGTATLPIDIACEVLNAQRCTRWTHCGVVENNQNAYRACLAFLNSTWCGPTRWTPRAQASPATLSYDPVKGQQCAEALRTQACSQWALEPAPCTAGQMLRPNATLGRACFGGPYNECAEGVCRGATCPRSCALPGTAGQVCNRITDCASGLYCLFSANGVGQCKAYGAMNQACDVDRRCAESLTCLDGTCQPLPLSGQRCLNGLCDAFAYCVSDVDGGTCVNKKAVNALCSDDSQCATDLLCDGLSQTCQPQRVNMLGASCSLEQTCRVGPACIGATLSKAGTCRAYLGLNEACLRSQECTNDLACVSADGGPERQCAPRAQETDVCLSNRDCGALATCLQGECTALPLPGQACSNTRACLWGPCVSVNDGGFVCVERLGPGANCVRDADCSSERCFNGRCLAACAP